MPEQWQVHHRYERIREKEWKRNLKKKKREEKKNGNPPFPLSPKGRMKKETQNITNFSEQSKIQRVPLKTSRPCQHLLRYPGLNASRQRGLRRSLMATKLVLRSLPCLTTWHSSY